MTGPFNGIKWRLQLYPSPRSDWTQLLYYPTQWAQFFLPITSASTWSKFSYSEDGDYRFQRNICQNCDPTQLQEPWKCWVKYKYLYVCITIHIFIIIIIIIIISPLNVELNPTWDLLAILGAHPIFHINRIKVNIFILLLII
jgi:hypothetical protein